MGSAVGLSMSPILIPIYTTGNAMRCNTQQLGAEKAAYICGICNPLQAPATPLVSLVMRSGQRFESARRLYFLGDLQINHEAIGKHRLRSATDLLQPYCNRVRMG
jgi:hypothetical protein